VQGETEHNDECLFSVIRAEWDYGHYVCFFQSRLRALGWKIVSSKHSALYAQLPGVVDGGEGFAGGVGAGARPPAVDEDTGTPAPEVGRRTLQPARTRTRTHARTHASTHAHARAHTHSLNMESPSVENRRW
jgi:hypothetical protein